MRACTAVVAVLLAFASAGAEEWSAGTSEKIVLDSSSYWRIYMRMKTPVFTSASGELKPVMVKGHGWKEPRPLPDWSAPTPPEDWTSADFDDSSWVRAQAPFSINPWLTRQSPPYPFPFGAGSPAELALICVRGKFELPESAKVEDMKLSVGYIGGVVVHLNGRELARAHLPDGKIGFDTLADKYPKEAYTRPDGKLLDESFDRKENALRYRERLRTLSEIPVPAEMLKVGMNVVAIEVYRSPVNEIRVVGKFGKLTYRGAPTCWPHACLLRVKLSAAEESAVVPNVARPQGIQVWNCQPLDTLYVWDYGNPCEKLRPIEIVGAHNGRFSGRLVVSSTEPIKNLKAETSDLVAVGGSAKIPSSAIQVRYAKAADQDTSWLHARDRAGSYRFDVLSERAPEQVPVVEVSPPKEVKLLSQFPTENAACWHSHLPVPLEVEASADYVAGAVQPIWVTVRVPRDALTGKYEGKLVVKAEGLESTEVAIHLKVNDWEIPDPKDFVTHNNFYQSHESAAMVYDVPLWSDKHFQLMGKSLELLAQVGNKLCIVHLISDAYCNGNSQSMVRWIQKPDGSYKYDFSIFDRYLDLYQEKVCKPKVLKLNVWGRYADPKPHGQHFHVKPYKVSLLDPATGKVDQTGQPDYGSPESVAFWKPVLMQIRRRLEQRGWFDVTALGCGFDTPPAPETVSAFKQIWPEGKWMHSAHTNPSVYKAAEGDTVPVPYVEHVWGAGHLYNPDYGHYKPPGWRGGAYPCPWKQAGTRLEWGFVRVGVGCIYALYDMSPLVVHRVVSESALQGNLNGIGRVGGDFWPLPGRKRGVFDSLAGGSHMGMSASTLALLSAGPDGPAPNERFEMLREGVQICEAMVFIQKALDGKKLDEELVRRCEEVLDQRARYYIRTRQGQRGLWWTFISSGWQAREDALFALATDVARASGNE